MQIDLALMNIHSHDKNCLKNDMLYSKNLFPVTHPSATKASKGGKTEAGRGSPIYLNLD